MLLPVEVTFRGMPPSPMLEALVRKHAHTLDKFDNRVTSCRVVVEQPHQHHRKGRHLSVRIDLIVPGGEIVVNRDPAAHAASIEPHVAVREAFQAARRQVQKAIHEFQLATH